MLKIKLIITCHDVVPFANSYLNISKENSRRAYLLNMADFLLVHNENSIVDLMQYYQIKPSKIICHPFPNYGFKSVDKGRYNKNNRFPFYWPFKM